MTAYEEVELLRFMARQVEERREQELEDLMDRQERLKELGWYVGQVDGIVGPLTLVAREGFQAEVGLDVNPEEVTDEFVRALFAEDAPKPPPPPEPAPAPSSPSATSTNHSVPWDRLAECESNQNWSIDAHAHRGGPYHDARFYGGLQFNKMSWDWAVDVGGHDVPYWPHHASREQQIAVAETLLRIHPAGIRAWPACAAQLGLG